MELHTSTTCTLPQTRLMFPTSPNGLEPGPTRLPVVLNTISHRVTEYIIFFSFFSIEMIS